MLVIENTHNRGGGTVWPQERCAEVAQAAKKAGLAVHLDGARLFNAQVAAGIPARKWADHADSVSVCFSKGLGAPIGSALCGSRELVREARRLRKRLGGGTRQAGILAAAALYALEHSVERLADDHRAARRLAEGLAKLPGVTLDLKRVATNMVFVEFDEPASDLCAKLKGAGVLANPEGSNPRMVRFVTHLDAPLPLIEEAGKKGVQVLCFQEVFTQPYFCPSQDAKWYAAAEAIPDGPTTKLMQDLAKEIGMVLVVPIFEMEQEGFYYNTAAVIDADGTYLGKYRKTHIPT